MASYKSSDSPRNVWKLAVPTALLLLVSGCVTQTVQRPLFEDADAKPGTLNLHLLVPAGPGQQVGVDYSGGNRTYVPMGAGASAHSSALVSSQLATEQATGSRYVTYVIEQLEEKLIGVDLGEEFRQAILEDSKLPTVIDDYRLVDAAFLSQEAEQEWTTIEASVRALPGHLTVLLGMYDSRRYFKPSSIGGKWVTESTGTGPRRAFICSVKAPVDDLPVRRSGRPNDERLGDYWRDLTPKQTEDMVRSAFAEVMKMFNYAATHEIDLEAIDDRTTWERFNERRSIEIDGTRWENSYGHWSCEMPFPPLPPSARRGM